MKKKTRGELVIALRELQRLIGTIGAVYGNDRSPTRAADMNKLTEKAFNIAVDALATDPPERTRISQKD